MSDALEAAMNEIEMRAAVVEHLRSYGISTAKATRIYHEVITPLLEGFRLGVLEANGLQGSAPAASGPHRDDRD